jgi:hypothetical protein
VIKIWRLLDLAGNSPGSFLQRLYPAFCNGSRKVFIGQNDPQTELLKEIKSKDPRNKGPDKTIRSNDELGVTGDNYIEALFRFSEDL